MQRLSVENLPPGITVPDLAALFRPFGWVTQIDLRPGTAAVDLAWGAWMAARDLDGAVYRGQRLAVRPARGPVLEPPARRVPAGDF